MLALLLISFLPVFSFEDHHQPNEFVVELTAESHNQYIKDGKMVFTMFYAPWCGHCKRTMPELEQACKNIKQQLASDDVICSRLDCTQHEEFCRQQGLRGYPTIKLVSDDISCEYKGARVEQEMTKWTVNFHHGLNDIPDVSAVKSRIGDGYSIVAFLEQNHEHRNLTRTKSCELATNNFIIISKPEVASELGIDKTNSFNLFENGTFSKVLPTISDANSLMQGIFFSINPLVPEYSHEGVQAVFSNYVSYYIAFLYDTEETLKKYLPELQALAESQSPKIRVFTVNGSNPSYKDVKDYFHVTELPQVVFYNDVAQNYNHFPQQEISVTSLNDFADGCLNGSVPIYIQSQPEPEGWEKEDVKVLVAHTHDKIFETYESGIILYYAPWCGHCEAFMPIWNKLGSLVAEKYKTIFVGKIDHTANYVPNVDVQGYPTVVAYKSKTEKIVYSGDRTLDDLEKFILSNLLPDNTSEEPEVAKDAVPETKSEESKDEL